MFRTKPYSRLIDQALSCTLATEHSALQITTQVPLLLLAHLVVFNCVEMLLTGTSTKAVYCQNTEIKAHFHQWKHTQCEHKLQPAVAGLSLRLLQLLLRTALHQTFSVRTSIKDHEVPLGHSQVTLQNWRAQPGSHLLLKSLKSSICVSHHAAGSYKEQRAQTCCTNFMQSLRLEWANSRQTLQRLALEQTTHFTARKETNPRNNLKLGPQKPLFFGGDFRLNH